MEVSDVKYLSYHNWYTRAYGDCWNAWVNFRSSIGPIRYFRLVKDSLQIGWHYGKEYTKLTGGGIKNGIKCAKRMKDIWNMASK